MIICNSCGGVLGRDCFNPTECAYIGQQQAQQASYDTQRTRGEQIVLKARIRELESAVEVWQKEANKWIAKWNTEYQKNKNRCTNACPFKTFKDA